MQIYSEFGNKSFWLVDWLKTYKTVGKSVLSKLKKEHPSHAEALTNIESTIENIEKTYSTFFHNSRLIDDDAIAKATGVLLEDILKNVDYQEETPITFESKEPLKPWESWWIEDNSGLKETKVHKVFIKLGYQVVENRLLDGMKILNEEENAPYEFAKTIELYDIVGPWMLNNHIPKNDKEEQATEELKTLFNGLNLGQDLGKIYYNKTTEDYNKLEGMVNLLRDRIGSGRKMIKPLKGFRNISIYLKLGEGIVEEGEDTLYDIRSTEDTYERAKAEQKLKEFFRTGKLEVKETNQ